METLAKGDTVGGSVVVATGALAHSRRLPVSNPPDHENTKTALLALWTDGFFNQHARRALKLYAGLQMQAMQARITSRITTCESPLEAAFIAWWMVVQEPYSSIDLIGQQQVTARARTYRLDFQCRANRRGRYAGLIGTDDAPKVAIELDGHQHHHKTPTQITRDNRRGRDLASIGWTVLRVSGSEFHADPLNTVMAVCEDADRVFQAVMQTKLLGA